MTNETRNQQHEAPDATDFLGGRYLKKEDLRGPVVVNIENVWSDRFKNERKLKLVVAFRGFAKPLILNTDNTIWLAEHFGTTKTAYWRGPITL